MKDNLSTKNTQTFFSKIYSFKYGIKATHRDKY